MIKKTLIICLTVCLFYLLISPVLAHPGRTDGSGGHTDHSTGEYHYHHGYSAHDHYDMDDDGLVDCPYDFNDKTGHSSGSGNSSSGNSVYKAAPTVEPTNTYENQTKNEKDSDSNDTLVTITAIVIVLGFIALPSLIFKK